MAAKGNRPTHRLSIKRLSTGRTGTAGHGWLQDDGRIGIQLEPCVTLSGDDPDLMLSLFPIDYKSDKSNGPAPAPAVEDVPF